MFVLFIKYQAFKIEQNKVSDCALLEMKLISFGDEDLIVLDTVCMVLRALC